MSRAETLSCAAAICRRYAANLSELPTAQDAALECAAILDDAAEQALTIAENDARPCQELFDLF